MSKYYFLFFSNSPLLTPLGAHTRIDAAVPPICTRNVASSSLSIGSPPFSQMVLITSLK